MKIYLYILFAVFTVSCMTGTMSPDEAFEIDVNWKLHRVRALEPFFSEATLTITNRESFDLESDNWELHYNQLEGFVDTTSLPESVRIMHVTGEYFKILPTDKFGTLSKGASFSFTYRTSGIVRRQSDAPCGFFMVHDGVARDVANIAIEGIDHQTLENLSPTNAVARYIADTQLSLLPSSAVQVIIPQPASIEYLQQMPLQLSSFRILADEGLDFEVEQLHSGLSETYGLETTEEGSIPVELSLENENALNEGSYSLYVDTESIAIKAGNPAGIFYGIQTLLQLVDTTETAGVVNIPGIQVDDKPRFEYRGSHLDVARNFYPVDEVKQFLDIMSTYKLNKFHFHISDDEGWRVEISDLPELTEVGSRRGYTPDEKDHLFPAYGSGPNPNDSRGSGFYSTSEFIDILQYAAQRHIEVIPEVGFPGHARAAIKAMEVRYDRFMTKGNEEAAREYLLTDFEDESEYSSAQHYDDNVVCVCLPGAERFFSKVIDVIIDLFDQAGLPLNTIHIGGDEIPFGAWQKSPLCEEYIAQNAHLSVAEDLPPDFFKKIKKHLDQKDIRIAGWEEVVLTQTEAGHEGTVINEDFIGENVIPYVWNAVAGWGRDDMTYKLANLGFEVIMCNSASYYFDMAYDRGVDEIGLSWSGYSDTRTIYETEPLNIYKRAKTDINGRPLSAEYISSREQLTPVGRSNFIGIQSQLWTESIRKTEDFYYLVYPKILAFAERAWAQEPDWAKEPDRHRSALMYNRAWDRFCNGVGQRAIPRIEKTTGGQFMRIPPPGSVYINDIVKANTRFPGLTIRYTTDGSEPHAGSIEYVVPFSSQAEVIKLKAFTPGGISSATSEVRQPNLGR